EIAPKADAAQIQSAINAAVKLRKPRVIVHFPAGQYAIATTLKIPANSDIQLVGDGFGTELKWTGDDKGTVLHLAGPSRALLRDLVIQAGVAAHGIVIENCDQVGARVFMEQGEVAGARRTGLLVDGLDNTDVSLHDFYHSGVRCADGASIAVKVVGGAGMAAHKNVAGRVAIFGGASSDNDLSYDLTNNARLIAEDIWYEGGPPRFINFTDKNSGTFTLNGGTTATGQSGPQAGTDQPDFAALTINGFHGDVSLLGVIVGKKILVSGNSADMNVLAVLHGTDDYFMDKATAGEVALLDSTKYQNGGGGTPITDQGNADPNFVLKMLAQVRTTRPRPLTDLPRGVTDVRFYRVTVYGGEIGINLSR
ncbi:MAG: hypothetical protein ABI210_09740, partial [Abditibacteriaceae bacterium]